MTRPTTTPAAARVPVDPVTLVDHSWLVGDGVLFCVAGSAHTATAVAGCAYWIRDDLAAGIAPPAWAPAGRPLTFRGATYRKLPTLANPADWPTVHNRLSERGITGLTACMLAAFDPAAALDTIEPRAAARAAASLPAHQHECGRRVPHDLHAALGDPEGDAGLLGLTGSAALDPTRLCAGTALDLLTFPHLTEDTLLAAIGTLGGAYLADLQRGDPRRRAFDASRFLPAGPDAVSRDRLWARRLGRRLDRRRPARPHRRPRHRPPRQSPPVRRGRPRPDRHPAHRHRRRTRLPRPPHRDNPRSG